MNIALAVDLTFKAFSGATITRKEAGLYNAMVDVDRAEPVVTQRPSIEIFEEASSERGRAIYFWDSNSTLYILNDDTIYKNSYSGNIATTITAGTRKCKFLQLNTVLVLLNPDDNKGYTITTGDTVTQIAGSFPATLVPGGAILDGYLFVMDDDGGIWNSDLDDATTFSAGAVVNAEREEDGGVYLGKHHDHVAAFNERTLEFFFDNANPSNSPLTRRSDVSHNIGCADGYSVWEDGDITVFMGTDTNGGIGIYVLENFRPRKISNTSIDTLLSQAITRDAYLDFGSGISAQGHRFYTITLHYVSTDIVPETTFVYDFSSKLWYEWNTEISGLTNFPVMDTTIRAGQGVRYTEGIMSNGDLFLVNNTYAAQDTIGGAVYVDTGYVDTGYFTDTSASGTAFTLKARTGQLDGDTNNNKIMDRVRPLMDATETSQTLTVAHSDNNNVSFTSLGTIDTAEQDDEITQCGMFRKRNLEVQYSGNEQVWLEGLDADVRKCTT